MLAHDLCSRKVFVRSITRDLKRERERKRKSFARNWNSGSLTGIGLRLLRRARIYIYSIRGDIMRVKSANHETPSCSVLVVTL